MTAGEAEKAHRRVGENSPGRMHVYVGLSPPPLRELLASFHASAYCVSFLISLSNFFKALSPSKSF